ncbi:MAG: tyrosine-type recombinase/integrase [Lachnospiraceae bacterium]
MFKKYEYSSSFANSIAEYISSRRELGFLFDNPAYWLYRFDQYCNTIHVTQDMLTKELYDTWAVRTERETKTTQNNRLQALRCFSIYLNTIGKTSYIPHNLPKPEKNVPYLLSDEEIREFFEQVDGNKVNSTVKPFQRLVVEYKVLFRLIYCCGLRNNEACSLKMSNVDLENGILTIVHSKGNKDRKVYLAEDICQLCSEYKYWLLKQFPEEPEVFFPGKYPDRFVPKTSIDRKFNEFWSRTGASEVCDKKPTVHCLRHAFVIKRMNLWMKKDISLRVMMPYLSSYLGHSSPLETYYYYHQVEDAFIILQKKDVVSSQVIPEVCYEEII